MITLKIKNLQILTICTAENKTKENLIKRNKEKHSKFLANNKQLKKQNTKHNSKYKLYHKIYNQA